jgi:general secretion pathway protein B
MSYILDALRKADAERERDPARGIHAQPVMGASASGGRSGPPAWMWAAGGALAVVVVGVVLWQGDGAVPQAGKPATPQPAVVALAAPTEAAPVLVSAPAPVPVATAVQPAPPPMPVSLPQAPVAAAMKAPAVQLAATATATAPAPAPAAAPAAPAKDAAAASERVYAFAELPADVQRDLPKLAISGGVHSDNAAQRMLIVGGLVMGEGAELAPGVVLEQIRPKTAVIKFRGYRYSVAY